MPEEILAKPDKTLIEHTEDVLKVFAQIKDIYPEAIEISGEENFWEYLFYCLILHDVGKSARGFQEAMKNGTRWNYRHEILSASFVSILNYDDKIKKEIAVGIISHHKDLDELRSKFQANPNSEGYQRYINALSELEENFDYVKKFLEKIPEWSENYLGKRLNNFKIPESISELTNAYQFAVQYFFAKMDDEPKRIHGLYGILLRGFIHECDYLASSGKLEIPAFKQRIEDVLKFEKLRDIQIEARKTNESVFIIAPTGYGKTEASLFWAENFLAQNPKKRVFYILPYTASINAMFERFRKHFGNELVGMKHHKSGYFIYKSFRDREYSQEESKKLATAFIDLNRKIFNQFKIMTHLQLLKSFFGVSGFELSFSEMAGSIIIVDEIHSYDARTIALLVETLKILKNELKAKILLMSATVPEFLKFIFVKELNINRIISPSPDSLKAISRHKIKLIDADISDGIELMVENLSHGKRVLVICNTVKKAQEIYKTLKEKFNEPSTLIHSRFALIDRERIEREIDKVKLLVGTQTIEVSLDIDFDALFTEIAPADRLIQRLGRVNRKGRLQLADVYIFTNYTENEKRIYDEELLKRSISVLSKFERITEYDVPQIINDVYGNDFTPRQKKIFEQTAENFKKLRKLLYPFVNNEIPEESFNELVHSVEVVPYFYENEYIKALDEKNYFEVVKYFIPLPLPQFFKLNNAGQLYWHSDTCFTKARYSPELGLLTDEFETNILE